MFTVRDLLNLQPDRTLFPILLSMYCQYLCDSSIQKWSEVFRVETTYQETFQGKPHEQASREQQARAGLKAERQAKRVKRLRNA
jgi:hypothetical protein